MIKYLSGALTGLCLVGLVFVLSACSSAAVGGLSPPGVKPTPEARYLAARLDLNALLGAAVTYANKPRCSASVVVGCSDQSVVDQLYTGFSAADVSLDGVGAALDRVRLTCETANPDDTVARATCLRENGSGQMVAISGVIAALGSLNAILLAEAAKGGA